MITEVYYGMGLLGPVELHLPIGEDFLHNKEMKDKKDPYYYLDNLEQLERRNNEHETNEYRQNDTNSFESTRWLKA